VSFLPHVERFSADFWAGALRPPNQRHAAAIRRHKYGSLVNAPVMKSLPESS